jgi:DNA-binding MarR family transcriptional regulator
MDNAEKATNTGVSAGSDVDAAALKTLRATACTCHMLRRTARHVTRYYDQALRPAGLSLSQYSLLANTRQAQSLSITELAELQDIERTTLTRNLQPLVQAGWIIIGKGPDKRSRAVQLTQSGQELFSRARLLWQQAEMKFRNNIGREDATNLRQLLDEAALATDI